MLLIRAASLPEQAVGQCRRRVLRSDENGGNECGQVLAYGRLRQCFVVPVGVTLENASTIKPQDESASRHVMRVTGRHVACILDQQF